MLWGENRGKWKKLAAAGSRTQDTSGLSHDSRTTTNPHNPLYVLKCIVIKTHYTTEYSQSRFHCHKMMVMNSVLYLFGSEITSITTVNSHILRMAAVVRSKWISWAGGQPWFWTRTPDIVQPDSSSRCPITAGERNPTLTCFNCRAP